MHPIAIKEVLSPLQPAEISQKVPAIELGKTKIKCKNWNTEEYFSSATSDEVAYCLESGVDVNVRSENGGTPPVLRRQVQ